MSRWLAAGSGSIFLSFGLLGLLGVMLGLGRGDANALIIGGPIAVMILGLAGLLIGVRGRATRAEVIIVLVLAGFFEVICLLSIVATVINGLDADSEELGYFAGMLIVGAVALALMIGVIGVSRRARKLRDPAPAQPPRSAGQRAVIWVATSVSVALGSLLLAAVLWTAAEKLLEQRSLQQARDDRRQRSPGFQSGINPPAGLPSGFEVHDGRVIALEEHNFRITAPSERWVQMPLSRVTGDAVLVMRRTVPEIICMVIVEEVGVGSGFDSAMLADVAQGNARSIASRSEFTATRERVIDGVAGVAFESDVTVRDHNMDFHYCYWVAEHNGFLYQVVVYGQQGGDRQIAAAAEDLFESFELIDADRVAAAGSSVAPYESDRFGYAMDLSRLGWRDWADQSNSAPEADFSAQRWDATVVTVWPVHLEDFEPDLTSLAAAAAANYGVDIHSSVVRSIEQIERADAKGMRVAAGRRVEGYNFEYIFDVLVRGRMAYVLTAWTIGEIDEERPAMLEALEQIRFTDAPIPDEPDRDWYSYSDLRWQGAFFNWIGIYHYEDGRYEAALDGFTRAIEFFDGDVDALTNVMDTLEELERYDDAIAYAAAHPMPAIAPASQARLGRLHLLAGDPQSSIEVYAKLYGGGYEDDDSLQWYAMALADHEGVDAAIQAIDEHARDAVSVDMLIFRCDMLEDHGRVDEAIQMLSDRARGAYDEDIVFTLADMAYDNDRYTECSAACDQLIEHGDVLWWAHHVQGLCQMEASRYREAKASFEASLAADPRNDFVRGDLEYVAGLLGRGDNALVKTPIEPVPLPELPAPEIPQDFGVEHGGAHLLLATAVTFTPGEDLRVTEYRRALIRDSRGVDEFASMEFMFDPLLVEIFVNHVIVRDASGAVVREGSVDDYYVLHDNAEGASFDRTLYVPVPGLDAGHTVDVAVTRRWKSANELPLIDRSFSWGLPVAVGAMHVDADPTLLHSHVTFMEESRDEQSVTWTAAMPALYQWEPWQDHYETFMPSAIVCSRGGDWADLSAEYASDVADRLAADESVSALAERLLAESPETDPVTTLARYVQGNVTYDAIEFGRRAWLPNAAPVVLQDRRGDCKDHSILLHQLLHAAGIDANLALVNIAEPVRPEAPSLEQFDHMIVYVPSLDRFIDATDKHSDVLAETPLGLGGNAALIIDEDGPGLVTIPDYAPDSSRLEISRDVVIDDAGEATVNEHVVLHGFWSAWTRQRLAPYDAETRAELVLSDLGLTSRGAVMHEFELINALDATRPLEVHLTYSLGHALRRVDDRLVGVIPGSWEEAQIRVRNVAERASPFRINYPLVIDSKTTVTPPAGAEFMDVNGVRVESTSPYWSASATSSVVDGALALEFTATRRSGRFPASAFPAFARSASDALAPYAATIVIKTR